MDSAEAEQVGSRVPLLRLMGLLQHNKDACHRHTSSVRFKLSIQDLPSDLLDELSRLVNGQRRRRDRVEDPPHNGDPFLVLLPEHTDS